jgi:CBS domain-containing protein
MKCDEVMKREVQFARDSDTVQAAAQRMRDRNIGFLPVCDQAGRVVGTLTDRDIAIRLVAEDRGAASCTVGQVMTTEVIACRPTDDLAEAERLMATRKKSRVLVTDGAGAIRGVISLSDVAERDSPARAAITLRQIATRETQTSGATT